MANNRMYIRCTGCDSDETLFLAKRFCEGYYLPELFNTGAVEKWFKKHRSCGEDYDHFKIEYEMEPNWDLK